VKRKALTLVEILVSAVLFASVVAGFLSVIVSTKRLNARSTHRMQAVYAARQILESLYEDVREDQWDANGLTLGNGTTVTKMVDGIIYTINYVVSDAPGEVRQVDVNVTWQEP